MSRTLCRIFALILICTFRLCFAEIIHRVPNPDPATQGEFPVIVLFAASSWDDAEAQANTFRGHLVSISSQAENDFINSTFSNFGGTPRSLWIGFNDLAVEGDFQWTDGSAVVYENWFNNEPNDLNGREDATLMLPNGQWNDAFSGDAIAFGVALVVPEPSTVVFLSIGFLLMVLWNFRPSA